MITVHYAQSLDGRLATRSGDSQWIGGPASLKLAHQLRAEHAAVLVGVGTVLADNPRLTVRLVDGSVAVSRHRRQHLAAAARRARPERRRRPDGGRHDRTRRPDRVASIEATGVRVLLVPADQLGRVDLAALLERLQFASVLIEGGGAVITSALAQQLVDRVVVTIAPLLIGAGTEAVGDLHVDCLKDARRFRCPLVLRPGR